jgi:hypothetical protein
MGRPQLIMEEICKEKRTIENGPGGNFSDEAQRASQPWDFQLGS